MQAVEEKYEEMNSTLQNILVAIGNVNQAGKNEIAKQLIEKGSILRQISIDLRHVFFPFL
jgi:hypothetical protein